MNCRPLYLALLLALPGCPFDSNSDGVQDADSVRGVDHVSQEAPDDPVFVLTGTLLDPGTMLPLKGITVELHKGSAAARSVKTDDSVPSLSKASPRI